jgi:hypothetical protein
MKERIKFVIGSLIGAAITIAIVEASDGSPQIRGSALVVDTPNFPEVLQGPLLKPWVEKAVYDIPPAGGEVTMICHWPPRYVKNDNVGEIWIVPALVKIVLDGKTGFEVAWVVYDLVEKTTDVRAAIGVREDNIKQYLQDNPGSIEEPATTQI